MMSDTGRLPFGRGDKRSWHWRWEQFYGSRQAVLHRIAKVEEVFDNGFIGVLGTTVCGRHGKLHMPGVVSRLAAPRCKQCCARLGIAPGDGAPYNRLKEHQNA